MHLPERPDEDELPPVVGVRLCEWLRDLTTPGTNPFKEIDDEQPRPATD